MIIITRGYHMQIIRLSLVAISSFILTTSAQATLKNDKITLKGNMVLEYNKLPSSADTISEAFLDGMFYGRLRTNMFVWDWKQDNYPDGKLMDNKAMGVGGSLVYKSAPLSGFSMTTGLYTSQNPVFFREDAEDVNFLKAGKDTLSRGNTLDTGNFGMSVLGLAYLQYDFAKTTLLAGRQTIETVFTKSNDTKMIPNTFDAITANIKDIPKTSIKLAYIDKQKLRDHTKSHDVLAYNPADKYSANDDSAVNKNLTVDRIGDDNSLLIVSVTNKSIKDLKLNLSYAMVPDVVSNLTLEAHYSIPLGGNWKVAPGIRYMEQFDNLDADYGVANLGTNQHGYKDANSLDSNLLALRVDVKSSDFLLRLGYSQIADEADIVAPWRGFPTGGFTRAMAQYNWFANTKTYMIRANYDFSKVEMLEGFSVMARYAIQDFDDDKDGVVADSKILHIDMRQNIGTQMEAKIRLGFLKMDDSIKKSDGSFKSDLSYNEYRFELNYFF